MERWMKILIWSVIFSVIGNLLFFIIMSLRYGSCYSDIVNYACGAGSLVLQGLVVAVLILGDSSGLTYILPVVVIFIIGFYIFPFVKKRMSKNNA